MKNTMDEMIDEFNESIGAEQGVIINVTSISSSSTLHEKLTMAINGDPGAPPLPDITTAYPKTAFRLKEKDLLVDLTQYFTDEELSAYIPLSLKKVNWGGWSLCLSYGEIHRDALCQYHYFQPICPGHRGSA